jgi:predicted site-specific integrase-resolvase
MKPRLLNGWELAEYLGYPQDVIMRWHRQGVIPSVKASGRVYFNVDRVVEAIRRNSKLDLEPAGS